MRRLDQPPKPFSASDEFANVRIAATLVTAGAIIAGLYYGREILIPFAITFLITFMLNPVVTTLVRWGMPKALAASLVIGTVVCAVLGVGVVLGAQFRSIAIELPRYQSTISSKLMELQDTLKAPGMFDGALKTIERVQKQIEAKEQKPAEGPPPQRVEIVPRPQTPLENAASWMLSSIEPLATAGIVLIFVFFALLDIGDLRDRLLRLLGGDYHRSIDAMQDAGSRISRYLLMQLVVNLTYGIPLAAGLWMIGVPGALLWGGVSAVMRFVPYIGPLISAVPPVALAFAVDDGWSLLLWTLALFAVLELISNNVVEPLLYGVSTGLSAISLIAAAVFWTALWGPVGLMLSTPLSVCMLVLGRNMPQLRFFEVMLGSAPALEPATRIYQRLIADDVDEAIDVANQEVEKSSVAAFYNTAGIETLRVATNENLGHASAEHRLRLVSGMELLIEDFKERYPARTNRKGHPEVICIGGKTEIDSLAGEILEHALGLEDIAAITEPVATATANDIDKLKLVGTEIICFSFFARSGIISARRACSRMRRHFPGVKIVLALWNAPAELLTDEAKEKLGADAVVTSVEEAVFRIQRLLDPLEAKTLQQAGTPDNDADRVRSLESTGILLGRKREDLDAIAKRAADVFDAGVAVISTIDREREYFIGQSGKLPDVVLDQTGLPLSMDRRNAICNYVIANDETLVIPDIDRDPRFAENETISEWKMRFYAGAPLRLDDGLVIGALCILDSKPRKLSDDEIAVLEKMAVDVVEVVTTPKSNQESTIELEKSSRRRSPKRS